jgi:hypothetical protein
VLFRSKTTKITKVDEDGKENVEYHETTGDGFGALARILAVIVVLGIILFVFSIIAMVLAGL